MSNIILSVVLGLMMVYIAFRQWRTSHQTLKLTLYDRRFKVYLVMLDYINKKGYPDLFGDDQDLGLDEEMRQFEKFIKDTSSYKFLFKKDVFDFMEELLQRGGDDPGRSPEINRQWFRKQCSAISDLFQPYLNFSKL